jgi:hypothetical protein
MMGEWGVDCIPICFMVTHHNIAATYHTKMMRSLLPRALSPFPPFFFA